MFNKKTVLGTAFPYARSEPDGETEREREAQVGEGGGRGKGREARGRQMPAPRAWARAAHRQDQEELEEPLAPPQARCCDLTATLSQCCLPSFTVTLLSALHSASQRGAGSRAHSLSLQTGQPAGPRENRAGQPCPTGVSCASPRTPPPVTALLLALFPSWGHPVTRHTGTRLYISALSFPVLLIFVIITFNLRIELDSKSWHIRLLVRKAFLGPGFIYYLLHINYTPVSHIRVDPVEIKTLITRCPQNSKKNIISWTPFEFAINPKCNKTLKI